MSIPTEYERNRSDILGAVTKLRICKTKLKVSEIYVIIYWGKNHVNSTLYAGNYWERFCFERHNVFMCVRARHCTVLGPYVTCKISNFYCRASKILLRLKCNERHRRS